MIVYTDKSYTPLVPDVVQLRTASGYLLMDTYMYSQLVKILAENYMIGSSSGDRATQCSKLLEDLPAELKHVANAISLTNYQIDEDVSMEVLYGVLSTILYSDTTMKALISGDESTFYDNPVSKLAENEYKAPRRNMLLNCILTENLLDPSTVTQPAILVNLGQGTLQNLPIMNKEEGLIQYETVIPEQSPSGPGLQARINEMTRAESLVFVEDYLIPRGYYLMSTDTFTLESRPDAETDESMPWMVTIPDSEEGEAESPLESLATPVVSVSNVTPVAVTPEVPALEKGSNDSDVKNYINEKLGKGKK